MNTIPVWKNNGPAQKIYDKYLSQPLLRDQWVQSIRELWGNPNNNGLALFPEISIIDEVIAGVPVTLLEPASPQKSIFMYLHGGSWMTPLSGKHLAWAKYIAYHANVSVYAVHYNLSPEFPYPRALMDCVGVYQALCEVGHRIIVGGDSSGGNLSAALCHYCINKQLIKPNKLLALCPMMDMFMEEYASLIEFGIGNPLADMSLLAFQRFCYVPNKKDWSSPYVSPVRGDLQQFPETLVIIGEQDALRDDNLRFAEECARAGIHIKSLLYKNMPHGFFMHFDAIPDVAQRANADIIEFLID